MSGLQTCPFADKEGVSLNVFAFYDHVLSGNAGSRNDDFTVVRRHVFLFHDCICPCGERRTGKDTDGLSRIERR